MRKVFPATIEAKRVRSGVMATQSGERQGAFLNVICRPTGEKLKILISDGHDWQEEGLAGEPWEHVSVSCMTRVPSWAEMCWVKEQFFEDSEVVVQFHPAKSNYVNDHQFVLHLWKFSGTFPMPPIVCV